MSARQPKLILRESCIDDVAGAWPAGRFLEVGAGTGYMTRKFLERGFHGACYDLGAESRRKLRANLTDYQDRIAVVDDLQVLAPASFDYVFGFEVLEHIEDDRTAIEEWSRYLKPGGQILLTVPAHAAKFGKSDEVVGHVRRYERSRLLELLAEASYCDIRLFNYGFPLTEVTRTVSNLLIMRERDHLDLSPVERSTRSSFSQPAPIRSILGALNEGLFRPFTVVQRYFYARDWGDGLLAVARKSDSGQSAAL
jgi:SAM-dependent methyltransferase